MKYLIGAVILATTIGLILVLPQLIAGPKESEKLNCSSVLDSNCKIYVPAE